MTKPLSKKEKRERKDARKLQRTKAKSTTVETTTRPKLAETPPGPPEAAPATPPPARPLNLCDDCAYEFGECEGVPKFAQEEGADDRVVECSAFVNVAAMPTADKPFALGPAPEIVIVCSGGCGRTTDGALKGKGEYKQIGESPVPEWTCQECLNKRAREEEPVHLKESKDATREDTSREAELIHVKEKEGATEEEVAEDLAAMEADLEARRRKTQRFFQEEDFGTCQSCGQPLKRTALNRDLDAIRCVNGRCNQYRFIIKTISTGV